MKVNGYRIELGEIEAQLTRHPAVKQAVVVARTDDGPAKLVGYVIADKAASAATSAGGGEQERVEHWQTLWDTAYKQAGEGQAVSDPRFNIAGWNDSYTGDPIPAAHMREWLDATVKRIVDLKPKRVLEIGCGTGMILYGVLPHVAHYTGVDVSPHALETIKQELTPDERAKVTLLNQPAHALEGVENRSVDVVVINSVAQYFPDHDYLTAVLERASELVVDGGHVFVGDVRSLAHLSGFHTLIELHRAGDDASGSEIAKAVTRRVSEERELTLAEGYFDALLRELPRFSNVEVRLKRAAAHNEMSVFRYDVVLTVGGAKPVAAALPAPRRDVATLDAVRAALSSEPEAVWLVDLPSARLAGITQVAETIARDPASKLESLKAVHDAGPRQGIEPESLYRIDDRYDVELRWAASGDASRFDALLRHKQKGPRGVWARTPATGPRASFANQPAKLVSQGGDLAATLRTHLREFLPEFMVPAAFVTLDAFPLTPNGKIDRKALPAPQQRQAQSTAEYLPPSSDLERQIAEVWQQMLNLERVGLRDNIFDLGANSLLTVQANNRLSTLLGRKVSLVSMFRFPTVESLAAHLGDGGKAPAQAQKREQERADRRTEAAERRRQARAERGTRGS
ncbi:MAG: methyltransferase [Polyangiales bacterium]